MISQNSRGQMNKEDHTVNFSFHVFSVFCFAIGGETKFSSVIFVLLVYEKHGALKLVISKPYWVTTIINYYKKSTVQTLLTA